MTNKKIIVSAYACDPSKGSEPSNGYNWADQLARYGHEVHCITLSSGKKSIEKRRKGIPNLNFVYVDLPFGLNRMYYWSQLGMYLHYLVWQWFAYKKAKKIQKQYGCDLVHHISWGSLQQGSFMYKLPIPLIFGPAGGAQKAPVAFKNYFGQHWSTEIKREKMSMLLQRFNPAFRGMVKKSKVILVSNTDTMKMAQQCGAKNVVHFLDSSLPNSFFDTNKLNFIKKEDDFKLLWVGRFLPRKGILLVLDVMKGLKQFPKITLTVVGDGETKEEFLKTIEEYNLGEQVHWVGKVPFEKVKEYYASHHAFLFTSLRDSGGVQLIEAMAYGLPVITLDLHGQGIMVDKDRGFKASVINPEKTIKELQEAIVYLNENRGELSRLSKNAYEYAKEQTLERKIKEITTRYYT